VKETSPLFTETHKETTYIRYGNRIFVAVNINLCDVTTSLIQAFLYKTLSEQEHTASHLPRSHL